MVRDTEVAMVDSTDPIKGHRVHELELHSYVLDDDSTTVDVKKVWEVSGTEYDIPVDSLVHFLSEPSWERRAPFEIGHKDPHWTLTMESDLSFPIIVTIDPSKYMCLVDGRHRLLKAWLLGHEVIKARMVDFDELLTCCI
jgi:hypothetical protein